MDILVLLKQTFGTEEKIFIENRKIKEDDAEFVINPYDEYAVEEAIRWRDEFGGEVTLLTVGPSRAESALRTALAMGADQAIHVISEESQDDEAVIAGIIAKAIDGKAYDLILAGNMAIDSGAGQVAVRVAERLGIPHVSTITKLTFNGNRAAIERDVEGDVEVVEVDLPFLATAQQGLNEPRYPSLPGIMKAKKKPLQQLTVAGLNMQAEELQPYTEVVDQYLPSPKQEGRMLQGELKDQVKELVHSLRSKEKIV
ncbi:electron transfer flavoprotein subunit beta/FixA family protein [Paenibacillus naphthalenovorans]|uniref:Electron transfer flavoprotein subunit beta n=1 Tax=Paenibacillus naphthalenovorans TaxID=162209 RepID=A0A0U2UMA0_9BACL|nr:electron transfer flavoprotein subunit beta/FixA family protein [Paenibacillus naphthalenovorans]ALS23073.1 subunit beta of electron transfer flavoprotein [Paenibacillus naphthalenovorans]